LILGVGIDLCEISRIARSIENRAFVEKVFSEEERAYADAARNPSMHYASSFAAKEAFAKAGRWGLSAVGLRSVWVSRQNGVPQILLDERAKRLLPDGTIRIHLSLSHEGDMAVAVVILEVCDDPILCR